MKQNNRRPLATPAAVIEAHGGEAAFWLAWIHGDLDAEVHRWFRAQALRDSNLAADLRSVEQRDGQDFSTQVAREVVANVLEASGYLPPAEPEPAEELPSLTNMAVSSSLSAPARGDEGAVAKEDFRELVRPAGPAFLEELGIEVPSGLQAAAYTELLNHLVGRAAVRRFRRLQQDAGLLPAKLSSPNPAALYRALRSLVPELCAGPTPPRLSYCLFLRARLKQFCRRRGWEPRDRTLEAACKDLTRARIGRIVAEGLQSMEQDELHEGLQLARADGQI